MASILEAIGNTPLVLVRSCAPSNGAELWLKLEYRNPTGSMKDRMALAMVEGAIFAGISTGANVVGVHRLAERIGPEAVIATLAVDTGFKYMSVSPFADM